MTRACLKPTEANTGSANIDGWFSEMPTVKSAEALEGKTSAAAQATGTRYRKRIGSCYGASPEAPIRLVDEVIDKPITVLSRPAMSQNLGRRHPARRPWRLLLRL